MSNPDLLPSRESILAELETVLASDGFRTADRSRALLRYLVEHAVDGRTDRLKEYTLGAEALGRGDTFDPRTDPIVRAEASRLRARLERYYAAEGKADPVFIVLPKGGYVPEFRITRDAPAVPPAAAPRSRTLLWFFAGALAAGTIALMALAYLRPRPEAAAAFVQFDVQLQDEGSIGGEVGTDAVISPDGTRIVFVSKTGGTARLDVHRLDTQVRESLPGTEGARGPFFSPDGRWIGFWAAGTLRKVPLDGGSPVILCPAVDFVGASWGDDDYIVAALGLSHLSRIPAAGGAPVVLLDGSGARQSPRWPQVIDGGRTVIFTAIGPMGVNMATIEALTLADNRRTVLVRGGTFGRVLLNGYLTYINQGTLFAVPFDGARLEAGRTAVPVLADVAYSPTFGYAQWDMSRTGTAIYRTSAGQGRLAAAWIDAGGNVDPLAVPPGAYEWPRVSPVGNMISLSAIESGVPLTLLHQPGAEGVTRLNVAGPYRFPTWSPDGRTLFLGGPQGMATLPADGRGRAVPLLKSQTVQVAWSVSPDGKTLAYHELSPTSQFDLWVVAVEDTGTGLAAGQPEPFLATPAIEVYPAFSPDGGWLAYASNESGGWEVYVSDFPGGRRKVKVSEGGARVPRWAPGGGVLFYSTEDRRLMAASYEAGPAGFKAGKPRQWWAGRLGDSGVLPGFDVAPDGRRVLALLPAVRPDEREPPQIKLMLNFPEELRRRAEARRN